MTRRRYRYVGPSEVLAAVRPGTIGQAIRTPHDFTAWLSARAQEDLAEPFTFVIDLDGVLRLAPRRSEHVACAGGERVLGAGEITFVHDQGRWKVGEISNQSTGYCPDPDSWPAVQNALDRAELRHPGRFTNPVIFRRCPHCRERNLVKEDDYFCALCGTGLPRIWNLTPPEGHAPDRAL